MADGFADWDAVVAFALTLPATELASFYGTPTPKVGGKAFVAIGREPCSFVLMTALPDKAMLMEIAPQLFWETEHYRAWPAVLVRLRTGERDWLETLVARAWWDKAPRKIRSGYGPRP